MQSDLDPSSHNCLAIDCIPPVFSLLPYVAHNVFPIKIRAGLL